MEQYLGQFVGIIISSLQNEGIPSTIFSGFLVLAGATIVTYMAFRILLVALKVGVIAGVLAIITSIGMPATSLSTGQQNNKPPAKEIKSAAIQDAQFSIPDLSEYLSEEKLRALFLSYIRGINR